MIPHKLEFIDHYSDGSGVERAVRYDDKQDEQVQIKHVDQIDISIKDLDWYIDRLTFIKKMVMRKERRRAELKKLEEEG